jgi:protoporphyrinogen oxidase
MTVTVTEGDTQAGGMAAHFDFGGISLERFYLHLQDRLSNL